MARITRRTLIVGGTSAVVGLLALARRVPPTTLPQTPTSPAPTTTAATTPTAAAPAVQVAGSAGVVDPNALRIPPLLSPTPRDGVRTFELTLQRGQVAFEAGLSLATLGINGPYLGPTLRARQGDAVAFVVTNQLGEPTTLHWHGMHLPAVMDGGPHQVIAPGAAWQPRYAIRQQAATLFYHPHLMGSTRAQVTGGLVGTFILDDDNPAQAALPHTYGVDDIPLILQGYAYSGGRLGAARQGGAGQGGLTLVNGTLGPVLATAQARLRLRLLNAFDQRMATLGFAGDVPFYQVASDGGVLAAPVRLTRLLLGPAERAEIVVDLADAPGTAPLVLQQFGSGGEREGGNGGPVAQGATLLTIRGPGSVAARAVGLPPLPVRLNALERLAPGAAVVTRTIVLGGGRGGATINGQAMTNMARMMDLTNVPRVRLGDLERWNVVNASRDAHVLHIHDVQFQVLARNGVAPGPGELGRKDTVLVRAGETVPLLLRCTDYADAETPYMFHCHMLQHEDQGMMAQFVVVPD